MRRLPLWAALALVGVVRWLVPRRHRARWVAEWRAELVHRWQRPDPDVLARSLNTIPHAAALARHERRFDTLRQDLLYAFRRLSAEPGFLIVAVLTIAIGVGANTAIFSVVNSTMINPLPVPDADRLVFLWRISANNQMLVSARIEDLQSWRDHATSFEEIQIYTAAPLTYTGGSEPEELIGLYVTPDFFSFLGVRPQRGRGISAEDARVEARVALISDRFWRSRLGGREDVLETTINLNGESYDVIGVLPRNFVFQAPFPDTPVWLPVFDSMVPDLAAPFAMARLKEGVSLEAANAELDALSKAAAAEGDASLDEYPGRASTPSSQHGDNFLTAMLAMQAAVGFVLLIACANVANLLLARGSAQQREMAVRAAMGAGRGRLIRQLLTENLLLALAGGVVGYGIARVSVAGLVAWKPESMTSLDAVRIDPSTLTFALAVAALTGVVFGLVPALQSSRPDVVEQIKDTTRSGTPSPGRLWTRSALVVAQVALSIVLLVGAGLLLHSLGRLLSTDVGFDADSVLSFTVDLPSERYPDEANRLAFTTALEQRVRSALGDRLDRLAFASTAPGRMGIWPASFAPEGQEPGPPFDNRMTYHNGVSPGYFRTMGVTLLHGRDFVPADAGEELDNLVVNATWARRMWGRTDVVGERFVASQSGRSSTHTVIGVVADNKLNGQAPGVGDLQSFSVSSPASSRVTMLVRTTTDPRPLISEVKQQVWALDPDLPIKNLGVAEDLMLQTVGPQRFNATLLTVAAALAVGLALIGLYGVLAYSVSLRTREIGVRMALGAEAGNLVRMVAWQGLRLVLIGLAIGMAAALALSRTIESLLYEVTPFDLGTYLAVTVLLVGVSLLACLVPAVRAARLDPMAALRSE